ncbi:hypothetical protein SAMN05444398_10475 [Roseovarius pacificus]|uniref:Uncharacterized protein n=1 Tax=Roseovarius pacificus TaxID=337701 RepID=A0A1M7C1T0_9RHOB|nr:hypothetical protein [Roseovarius pacificus]GGO55923.1 hypothetical protein GCM10011315_19550 [Roseovarius pacificus]SHL61195.1 hypothetical protein SAMN05444398_10475 [Roseovarius pacificus]
MSKQTRKWVIGLAIMALIGLKAIQLLNQRFESRQQIRMAEETANHIVVVAKSACVPTFATPDVLSDKEYSLNDDGVWTDRRGVSVHILDDMCFVSKPQSYPKVKGEQIERQTSALSHQIQLWMDRDFPDQWSIKKGNLNDNFIVEAGENNSFAVAMVLPSASHAGGLLIQYLTSN